MNWRYGDIPDKDRSGLDGTGWDRRNEVGWGRMVSGGVEVTGGVDWDRVEDPGRYRVQLVDWRYGAGQEGIRKNETG